MGVNVFNGKVENTYNKGVVEPLVVKEQAIKSAAEAASMILRIDDVIAATKPKEGPGKMPEGPEGEE
jgi:chaperonin GroEL (HSP60 family)